MVSGRFVTYSVLSSSRAKAFSYHPVHAVPDGYVNLTDLTERLGYSPKSRGVVWQLCQSGRIPGAYQIDNKMREWVAPWPCIVHIADHEKLPLVAANAISEALTEALQQQQEQYEAALAGVKAESEEQRRQHQTELEAAQTERIRD